MNQNSVTMIGLILAGLALLAFVAGGGATEAAAFDSPVPLPPRPATRVPATMPPRPEPPAPAEPTATVVSPLPTVVSVLPMPTMPAPAVPPYWPEPGQPLTVWHLWVLQAAGWW